MARAIARGGHEVIVIERERQAGRHLSSRNSEVIHAGIHYAPGSLKARLCARGKELLYRYCEEHGIGHRRCGKLTVAASAAQIDPLRALAANARACGVELQWLQGEEARRLEPELHCALALFSPCTGIIDSAALLQCLMGDAESYGANRKQSVCARWVVNCAGLSAAAVAGSICDFPQSAVPKMYFAKGNYFSLPGPAPFSHLIYPAPADSGHLGVHLTLDLAGSARFGPDLKWLDAVDAGQPDYTVDAQRAHRFIEAIREYWPAVPTERLVPAYAGIRPKLSGPGEAARDFLISGPADHGIPGIVNLFGIESPGLTSCLALGDVIAAMIA